MFSLRSRLTPAQHTALLFRRYLATETRIPQTYIEKVVQRHSVGLPEGKVVRAVDYVMIKPQHVMTHVSLQSIHSSEKRTKLMSPILLFLATIG